MVKFTLGIVAIVVACTALALTSQTASTATGHVMGPVKGSPLNSPISSQPLVSLGYVMPGSGVAPSSGGVAMGIPAPVPKNPRGNSASGALIVEFEQLSSYRYILPEEREDFDPKKGPTKSEEDDRQIPKEIRELSGKTVEVAGYMFPMEVDDDRHIKSFILSRYPPFCCFGQYPEATDLIDVVVAEGVVVDYVHYASVFATGVIDVGVEYDKYGFVKNLYRMTVTKVESVWSAEKNGDLPPDLSTREVEEQEGEVDGDYDDDVQDK